MLKEHRNHLKQRRMREKREAVSMKDCEMQTLFESVAAEEGLSREELSNYIFQNMCENSVKLIDAWDEVIEKIRNSPVGEYEKQVILDIIFGELREVFPDWR